MKRRILNDEQAVSPVIAVILMVAITVVLAAVLYVWASSFLGGTTKNAPVGSMQGKQDSAGTWTVTIIKINPEVSVNSVNWYLLDTAGTTVMDGLVSDIYGYYSDEGKSVTFSDNDFNGKVTPGDKFEVQPGGDLPNNIGDYKFRMKFTPTGDTIGFDVNFGT
tara:strand:+ start:559 stop:1047 length:489 start_codon:yes stop_codon:yes gene_type:complete